MRTTECKLPAMGGGAVSPYLAREGIEIDGIKRVVLYLPSLYSAVQNL